MKTLIIIRHSKAEKGSGRDIDRHLTETGHRDAIQVAELLKSKGYEIDKILSSNSERTKRTTQLFSGVLGIDNDAVFSSRAFTWRMCWAYQKQLSCMADQKRIPWRLWAIIPA